MDHSDMVLYYDRHDDKAIFLYVIILTLTMCSINNYKLNAHSVHKNCPANTITFLSIHNTTQIDKLFEQQKKANETK